MNNRYTSGSLIHGEFYSADASALNEANSRILLYGAGSTTAITLDSNDNVVITDIKVMVGATGLTVTVYDGANNTVAAGEVIAKGLYSANNGEVSNFAAPHVCQKGTWPKVLTSASGDVFVYIKGYIYRSGV